MATETVENYIKAIFLVCRESATGEAGMSRIASAVGVTTGTATSMVKKLAGARLARYERFGGVRLTPRGTRVALDILRRHRLVETFLVRTLKLDWAIVHHEAERLEHALSPVVLEALDVHLGRPATDPHGDPIPDRGGRLRTGRFGPLASHNAGACVRVEQIADQREMFLRFVATHGLVPGRSVRVRAVDHGARAMTVQSRGAGPVTLAFQAADAILVSAPSR
ncbi:MAG: metal-dependent transcriptional regulator [Planctomyces sp.]|nr:metal-dependent transcriptional regulator [Planctomyces sp.]